MFERNYFGMMMVETGEADACITGLYTKYSNTIKVAKEVIGLKDGYNYFGTMHILNSKKGTYFISDTLINRSHDVESLKEIARLTEQTVRFYNHEPVMAMVSYSNFGTDNGGSAAAVHSVIEELQREHPDWAIDGEMQLSIAMNSELRDKKYPFSKVYGKEVNTLIFPCLNAANSAYKMLQALTSDVEIIGPIQMGLNKPIHFIDFESSVQDIVNVVAVASIGAMTNK